MKSLSIAFVFCHFRLQEEKIKLQVNLTFQFLLKQGQVEVESTEIPDYADAIFIKKSIIEELNCNIMVIYKGENLSFLNKHCFSETVLSVIPSFKAVVSIVN